ncbi:hypothetical protein BDQ94DRAFT_138064 [Aspergillus welwitschiae]|uniref:Uncharacterized protein n=1 Tax=Aspergillus welwitschiae TaxID=1341132 RepID=A0A3F3QCP7_9EURO|nr:hypothetical protein BDQ94DRAFT_138064 [Aspergillus welwitschiae]RDH36576.1 hypothetical protein BDQ94DRAFT_138064 [Aspergillus welwitschiae]
MTLRYKVSPKGVGRVRLTAAMSHPCDLHLGYVSQLIGSCCGFCFMSKMVAKAIGLDLSVLQLEREILVRVDYLYWSGL